MPEPSGEPIPEETEQLYFQDELPLFVESSSDQSEEVVPSPEKVLTFLGWEKPLLDLAVDQITRGWDGAATLDLSDHLIFVPTRNAGRLLREKLATHASKFDTAVIPPMVTTPGFLSSPARLDKTTNIASSGETNLIWSAFLEKLPLKRFRNVFPIDPVDRDLSWATETARELVQIRHLLAGIDADFADVSEILGEHGMEPQRWRELADLEKEAIEFTSRLGYEDEFIARRNASRNGALPPGIEKILVIAIPDLTLSAEQAVERLSRRISVEVMVFAPSESKNEFDDWGRPLADTWENAEIPIPHPDQLIHQAANPTDQAAKVVQILSQYEDAAGLATIGIPDTEVASPVSEALAMRGITTHDPSGITASRHGIGYLLLQTRHLVEDEAFPCFLRLLRCPDFLRSLVRETSRKTGDKVHAVRLLEKFDDLRSTCLPDRLSDAVHGARRNFSKFPELESALQWTRDWVKRLKNDPFSEAVIQYLGLIFGGRVFTEEDETKDAFSEIANTLLEGLDLLADADRIFGRDLRASEKMDLLLQQLRELSLYDERGARDIDLQGWLELPWDATPHLILTGFNDHVVPESIIGHTYLPDSARLVIGLETNQKRFAREAFLFHSLLESRANDSGRVDMIFGRFSNDGTPLRPSRLLFQCPDEALPGRVQQFFQSESTSQQPEPWNLPWKLQPAPLPEDHRVFETFSVTGFRNYLQCPFRFYLRQGLRMDDLDIAKNEMDAMEFGNLVHDVVDAFGRDETASASTDEKEIDAFFSDTLDWMTERLFGKNLTTPVMIQKEAARKRLQWWARLEAGERQAGWQILETETNIGSEKEPFLLSGSEIKGRIDRIEYHPNHGYRVFDFKTGSIFNRTRRKNDTVADRHLAYIKKTQDIDSFPEWALVENEKGTLVRWADLQIPLYVLAVQKRFPEAKVLGGYITLGPSVKEVGHNVWDGLDERLLESARQCAENIIHSVQVEKKFWPPSEGTYYRGPEEEILFGNPEESVDPSGLQISGD